MDLDPKELSEIRVALKEYLKWEINFPDTLRQKKGMDCLGNGTVQRIIIPL